MKIVYTFFIKLPLIALVTHTSRLRSLAAPARTCAPGSACASQSRPRISTEASRRDRRCESVPFPLASRFPFRMMRATEDRRRIWAPSPRYTAEFKQKAVELYKKSGTIYAEVARGLDCDAGACPTGSRRPTRLISGRETTRSRWPRTCAGAWRENEMLLKASAFFASRQL